MRERRLTALPIKDTHPAVSILYSGTWQLYSNTVVVIVTIFINGMNGIEQKRKEKKKGAHSSGNEKINTWTNSGNIVNVHSF